MSRRARRILPTGSTALRPCIVGRRGAVASNPHLSANAGAAVTHGSKPERFPAAALAW